MFSSFGDIDLKKSINIEYIPSGEVERDRLNVVGDCRGGVREEKGLDFSFLPGIERGMAESRVEYGLKDIREEYNHKQFGGVQETESDRIEKCEKNLEQLRQRYHKNRNTRHQSGEVKRTYDLDQPNLPLNTSTFLIDTKLNTQNRQQKPIQQQPNPEVPSTH